MQGCGDLIRFACCRSGQCNRRPFTHALALGFSRRVSTEGSSKRLFLLSPRLPYPTRKKRVCMDCLGENTALCTPQSKMRTALIKRLLKHIGPQVKLAYVYKRIDPSCALGVFCFKYIKSGEVRNQSSSLFHPWRTVDK